MISFVKFVAVFSAGCIATLALAGKPDDSQTTPKPDGKEAAVKKAKKKSKGGEDGAAQKKPVDVPVVKGHDSLGLHIPYFGSDGKRQMNFTIGVASRLDDNHVQMKDLQIETFTDEGEHEMSIDLPTSVLDTDKSMITTNQHVTIERSDFKLTGETMIFYTKTKQGAVGGGVYMLIYNLDASTSDTTPPPETSKQ